MKTMSRFAMTALFCGLSMVAANSVFAASPIIPIPPPLKRIVFPKPPCPKNPRLRLDWCNPLSNNCGKQTADAFCKEKGFDMAITFPIDPKLGRTMTLSGQMCTSPPFNRCDGFKFITCVKR